MSFLKKLFGPGPDFKKMMADGAVILDVRSPGEYASGHIKGSKNIPLQQLLLELNPFPKTNRLLLFVLQVCEVEVQKVS